MFSERKRRSLAKALSWRVVATITTALIVYCFTGQWLLAISVGGVEAVLKMCIYFAHERVWNQIPYGKDTASGET